MIPISYGPARKFLSIDYKEESFSQEEMNSFKNSIVMPHIPNNPEVNVIQKKETLVANKESLYQVLDRIYRRS